MKKGRVLHPTEDCKELFPFRYSKSKILFYSKIELDSDTRKIIKFLNSMKVI